MGEFVGGNFVGDVVALLVFRGAVPFFLVDKIKLAAFAGVGSVEGAFVEFDAFGEDFDNGEAIVIHGAFKHLRHVGWEGGVGAGDEGGAVGDEFFDGIDGLIDGSCGIGFGFEADGGGGRGLFFGEAVDEVVHDDVADADVFAGAMIEVVAADGVSIAVAAKGKDAEVGASEADARGKGDGAAVDEVGAVGVDEVGETGGAADAGDGDDLFVGDVLFFEDFVECGKDGEVAAAGAPGGVVGGEGFFGELGTLGEGFGGGTVDNVEG